MKSSNFEYVTNEIHIINEPKKDFEIKQEISQIEVHTDGSHVNEKTGPIFLWDELDLKNRFPKETFERKIKELKRFLYVSEFFF